MSLNTVKDLLLNRYKGEFGHSQISKTELFQVKEKGLRPLAVFLAVPYYMSGWILNMPLTK